MNKEDIVKKPRERGLSRRNAVRIFNQIFDEMVAALSLQGRLPEQVLAHAEGAEQLVVEVIAVG